MRARCFLSLATVVAVGCTSGPRPAVTGQASTRTIQIAGGDAAPTNITTTTLADVNVVQVAAPMDRAWAALHAAYDSVGIPVATVDPSQRLLGNTGFRLRRKLGSIPLGRYLDCGAPQGIPNAETYEVFLAVTTRLEPGTSDGWTQATTSVQASAKSVSIAGASVTCSSSGALEGRIAETLRRILQS